MPLAPLDEKVDHVRGSLDGRLIIEYGDYECPYSRQAFYAIQEVERQLDGNMRFAFRHFPLTSIHPHALAAAAAAEAAALQDRFWDMHELLFHWQEALEDSDLIGSRWRIGSAGMWTAAWPPARCWARRPCSSTASSTAAATTRRPYWPR